MTIPYAEPTSTTLPLTTTVTLTTEGKLKRELILLSEGCNYKNNCSSCHHDWGISISI